MKPIHYIKKYKLSTNTHFSHEKFAVDFGQDFMSRLETYKEFERWSLNTFFDLISEMRKKWEMIDLKCIQPLPEKLWAYIRSAIFMKQFDNEFPTVADDREALYELDANELATWLSGEVNNLSRENLRKYHIDTFHYHYDIGERYESSFSENRALKAGFEWDGQYEKTMIGSLGLKPNMYWERLKKDVDRINDYLMNIAFDELTYQLKRMAASKAKIQFKIFHDRQERRKDYFNFFDFIVGSIGHYGVNASEYADYFDVLKLSTLNKPIEKITESEVKTSYRLLSMQYHPDKGGNREKFEEVTEAKNKCLEFITILNRK